MRSIVVVVLLLAVAFSAAEAYGQEEKDTDIAYGMGRGVANVLTGWVEVPHCLVYESVRVPIVGFAFGCIKGGGFAVLRTVIGFVDFTTLGLTGDELYSEDIPDFVWQAEWIPAEQYSLEQGYPE